MRIKNIVRANLQFGRSGGNPSDSFEFIGWHSVDDSDRMNYRTSFEHADGSNMASDRLNAERKYYGNLELQPGASWDEIKKSYRKLISRYHPDRFHRDPEKKKIAGQLTAELNEAWSWFKEKHHKQSS